MSDKFTNLIFTLSGILTISILLIIVTHILANGLGVIDWEFVFSMPEDSGRGGGIWPMILSSFYLIVIASVISIPIGVGSAVYMVEYATNEKLISLIRFVSQILSSIPSIVFGLFGLAFLVFCLKMDWSLLLGGLILSLMSIPTIFQVSEVSLQSVPGSYREGCYAMGATKWQSIKSVILPAAISGIFTGIILAITRAISEAAAVMYVVGSSIDLPTSIFDTGRPLPLHLYVLASEGISMENAYGTAAVLVVFVLLITLVANYLVNNYQNKIMGV